MFVIYAKDIDTDILCSDRYQETECLGVYSTIEIVKRQIECHKRNVQSRRQGPKVWDYYVYECELDQPQITIKPIM